MNIRRTVLAVTVGVVLGVLGSCGPARADVASGVDALVTRQLAEHRIPGAVVVVVEDGRQVHAEGYGTADLEDGTPVDPDRTGFFTASVAKVFTAVAVLQQVERGRLDLDADVNRYLRAFQVEDTYPGRPVTVRDLLTHTAGFDDSVLGRATARAEEAPGLAADLAAHRPPRVRPPGVVASYDNYGVALAGHLVETVSGTPFAQYVRRQLLAPLGMDRTSFAQPHPPAIAATLAHGYRPDGDGQARQRGQYGAWTPTGAGAVTTAADMGRLLRALLGDGSPVLTRGSNEALRTRQFGNDPRLPGMGLVLEERQRGGQRMWVKYGDLPGFHSALVLVPERRLGVFVAYNGDGRDGGATWAAQELVDRLAGGRDAPPRPESRSAADVEQYAGHYRSTRTSRSDLTAAAALTGSVHVTAGPDGTLTTTGPLSRDPDVTEQRWVRVRSGLFREQRGKDRIAFRDGRLHLASDPSVAYERLPRHASPVLHQGVLAGGLAVLLATAVGLPVLALVRRRSHGAGPRVARSAAWATSALLVAAAACFALLTADPDALNATILLGDSPLLTAVPVLTAAATVTTGVMAVCTVPAWRGRWWSLPGRLHHTGTLLAAGAFLAVCAAYRLLPWP